MGRGVSDQRRANRAPPGPSRLRRVPAVNDWLCTSKGLTRYFRTANQGAMLARLCFVGRPLCAVLGVRAMCLKPINKKYPLLMSSLPLAFPRVVVSFVCCVRQGREGGGGERACVQSVEVISLGLGSGALRSSEAP